MDVVVAVGRCTLGLRMLLVRGEAPPPTYQRCAWYCYYAHTRLVIWALAATLIALARAREPLLGIA